MKPFISLGCALWLCGHPALADTETFIPVADTTISGNNGAMASGVTPHMIVGHLDPDHANTTARGLLRFDLSSLPSGIVITSVTLKVSVTASASAGTDTHSLHALNTGWAETSATWIDSGGAPWEEQGGDFVGAPDASVGIAGVGAYTFASTASLIATVQTWATNATANHGWILRSETESTGRSGRRLNTREAPLDQPTLTVGYTIPPPPLPAATLTQPRVADNKFSFGFVTTNGVSYLVQYKESLTTGGWIDLTNFHGAVGGTNLIEDSLSPTQRYYRVVSP
ncbi:MAG TPA: DNRLRE domain-containing protein [Candidatus Limnocylindria bacterium]|nr:DNRLRE domain-containing protein [Candidatus Limnocylindria bacterium]